MAAAHRGRGLGAALYEDVFAFASQQRVATVTCEFDVEPPNEVSRPQIASTTFAGTPYFCSIAASVARWSAASFFACDARFAMDVSLM